MRRWLLIPVVAAFLIMFLVQLHYYHWLLVNRGAGATQYALLYVYSVAVLAGLAGALLGVWRGLWNSWLLLAPPLILGALISATAPWARLPATLLMFTPLVYAGLRAMRSAYAEFATALLGGVSFLWAVDSALDLPPILGDVRLLYLAAVVASLTQLPAARRGRLYNYLLMAAALVVSAAVLAHVQTVVVSPAHQAYPNAVALLASSAAFAVALPVAAILWAGRGEEIEVVPYGETVTRT